MAEVAGPLMPSNGRGPTWPLISVHVRAIVGTEPHEAGFVADATNPDQAVELFRMILTRSAARHPTTPNPGPGRTVQS